jgi:hypothetical protein
VLRNLKTFLNLDALHFVMRVFLAISDVLIIASLQFVLWVPSASCKMASFLPSSKWLQHYVTGDCRKRFDGCAR